MSVFKAKNLPRLRVAGQRWAGAVSGSFEEDLFIAADAAGGLLVQELRRRIDTDPFTAFKVSGGQNLIQTYRDGETMRVGIPPGLSYTDEESEQHGGSGQRSLTQRFFDIEVGTIEESPRPLLRNTVKDMRPQCSAALNKAFYTAIFGR